MVVRPIDSESCSELKRWLKIPGHTELKSLPVTMTGIESARVTTVLSIKLTIIGTKSRSSKLGIGKMSTGRSSNHAFEPPDWRLLWRVAGALEEFAPAARSNRQSAAAQRGR